MASIGDVFLRLLLDDSDFETQVVAKGEKAGNKAGAAMGQSFTAAFSKGATAFGKTLANVGQNLTKTGSAMTRNLTLPLIGAGAAVTHFALDFDTTLRRVVGLTDVTGQEIDGIRDKILKLAPAVGKGPEELAQAFYFVASAGFKADEAMAVLETSAKAAATGLGDTQTVAQVLGSVINAYGKENITAARAADILVEAVSQGTAEADQFAGVIGRVVPIAASLGVSFDQVAAALAGMTLSGVDADEAATALRQILVSILKPANEANDALASMGLSAEGLRAELREKGLLATLRTLDQAFAGNADATAKVFGNVRALAGIQNLLGLSSEQLNQVFGKVTNSLGRLEKAYQETEGPQREIDRAMADLQASAIQLGADTLPVVVEILKQLAGGARELAKWWKSLDEGTRKQIVQLLAWVAVAGPALLVLGKLASGAGALFRAVGFLAGANGLPRLVGALKNVKLATLGWLGVILLVNEGLNVATPAISDFFDELVEGKKANKVLHELNDLTGDMLKAQVLRKMGVDAKKFSELIERAGGDTEDAFQAMVDAGGDFGKAMDKLSIQTGEALALGVRMGRAGPQAIAEAREKARLEAAKVPQDLAATLADGEFVVRPAAEKMVSPIDEALQKAVEDAGKRAQDIIDALAGTLADAPQQLKDELQKLRDALEHPYLDVKRRADLESALANSVIIKNLQSGDSQIAAAAAQQVQKWLAEYELLAPGALAAGELVNPALQAGIDRNLGALVQWINQDAGLQITNAFDLADVLESMGYDGLAGYVRGQEQARQEKLGRALLAGKQQILEGLPDDLYDEGHGAGASYSDGINDGLHEGEQRIHDYTGKIRSLLQFAGSPPFTESRKAGEGVGQSWLTGLIENIKAGLPSLGKLLGGALGDVSLTPALAGLPVPAAIPPGMSGAGMGGPSVVNNTWELHVNGVPYQFKTRDEFIKALDQVARFGEGRAPNG